MGSETSEVCPKLTQLARDGAGGRPRPQAPILPPDLSEAARLRKRVTRVRRHSYPCWVMHSSGGEGRWRGVFCLLPTHNYTWREWKDTLQDRSTGFGDSFLGQASSSRALWMNNSLHWSSDFPEDKTGSSRAPDQVGDRSDVNTHERGGPNPGTKHAGQKSMSQQVHSKVTLWPEPGRAAMP